MKDLAEYFASPPKSCETIAGQSEVRNQPKKVLADTPTRKRSRVKIKISVKDSEDRVCDIVESRNDLVDKTPSPFTGGNLADRAVPGDEVPDAPWDDTPRKARGGATEREESDAFKVLMTRKKPARYKLRSPQEAELAAGQTEGMEAKLGQTVDRKDRKGYSKRKLTEMEEGEKVDKRLESRAKVFRMDAEKEQANVGGLLNYFTKTTPEQKRENPAAMSTMIVKADVHASDEADKSVGLPKGTGSGNRQPKITDAKGEREEGSVLPITDDVHPIQSESLNPSAIPKQLRRTRPKWSMQIKLISYSEDDSMVPEVKPWSDDDQIFTPKSKAKHRHKLRKHKSDREHKHKKREEDTVEEITSATLLKKRKHKEKRDKSKNIDIITLDGSSSAIEPKGNGTNNVVVDDDMKTDRTIVVSDDSLSEDKNCLLEVKNNENAVTAANCEVVKVWPVISKIKEQGKLAPMFLKKSKTDPAVQQARRSFLQSGVPENMKKIMERKTSSTDLGTPVLPFPIVSHIPQLETESISGETAVTSNDIAIRIHDKHDSFEPCFDVSQFKFVTDSTCTNATMRDETRTESKLEKADIEAVLTELEKRCSDVRTIWQTIAPTINGETRKPSPKKRGRGRKSRSREATLGDSLEAETVNPMWTCKYKPTGAAETVGNECATAQLRNWLDGWKLPSNKDEDSSDEFYSSDASYSSSNDNNQVAVLLGPHGSGKTASVYAVAEELGYRVLEVNASSRRTGKKFLSDFQEATKSHRVKKSSSETCLLPIIKQGAQKKVPQNSLILIEDVDLIFDEDEGFISAVYQLAANTRRPIVLTCKEKCSYLSKMVPQQLSIHFKAVTGARVSALLELISLAESGYRLPQSYLDVLLHGDLRQALLQLQYLLLSGPPALDQLPPNTRSTLWQDLQKFLYKPAVKASKKRKKDEHSEAETSEVDKQNVDILNSMSEILDCVSLVSSIVEVEDPAPFRWAPVLTPSLSLDEDTRLYSSTEILGEEIAEWLSRATLYKDQNKDPKVSQTRTGARLAMRRQIKLGIDQALSLAIPWTLEHSPTSTDYLPMIRNICRIEQDRVAINTKRGNRFHHYLHGLNLPSASTKPNILEAACKIMQEKLEKC